MDSCYLRRPGDPQDWLDLVLELLGVPVARRVPHAVEDGSYDLCLIGEDRSVQRNVDDRRRRLPVRVERVASRVVGLMPADRVVDGEPLPLLERVSDLGREVD